MSARLHRIRSGFVGIAIACLVLGLQAGEARSVEPEVESAAENPAASEEVSPAAPSDEMDPASIPHFFEPVRISPAHFPDDTEGFEVSVWGRRYSFAAGPLPRQVESQGIDLLLGPARFELSSEGRSGSPTWTPLVVEESNAERVRFGSSGRFGKISLTATTIVEYDGMIRVDLSMAADEPTQLDRFRYEFEFSPGVAKYFNHHLSYDFDSMRVDKTVLMASAGSFPGSLKSVSFVPTFSIGNRRVGMEWWSESNANWIGREGAEPIEFGSDDAGARFRVTPVDGTLQLTPKIESRWSHTFAVFPAPMRNAGSDWRTTRFTPANQARQYDHSIGTRFVWIAFPGHFDARWHGLPESRPGEKQVALRKRLEKGEVSYIPYGKLTAAPSLHPLVLEKVKEWSATDRLFRGTAAAQKDFLKARGWRPRQVFGYAACMARTDYLDWMLSENLKALRNESLDGLYFDWGAINEPCRRDPRVKEDGSVQAFNYFNVRDFYKRLYQSVKAIDPNALIAIHTQGQPRSLAAFVDYAFVGEALNVLFRQSRSFVEVRKNPRSYDPDYYSLPPGFLDAQFFPPVGGAVSLLPEVKHGLVAGDSKRGERLTRAFYAIALVNDISVWLTNTDPSVQIAIYRALDRFGGLGDVKVFPWWDNVEAIGRDSDLRVTAYVKNGRALLVLANWTNDSLESDLSLDLESLELAGVASAFDPESNSRSRLSEGGKIPVIVPARDFRLLILD